MGARHNARTLPSKSSGCVASCRRCSLSFLFLWTEQLRTSCHSASGSESRAPVNCNVVVSSCCSLVCECVIQRYITIALSASCLSKHQHFCSSDVDAGD